MPRVSRRSKAAVAVNSLRFACGNISCFLSEGRRSLSLVLPMLSEGLRRACPWEASSRVETRDVPLSDCSTKRSSSMPAPLVFHLMSKRLPLAHKESHCCTTTTAESCTSHLETASHGSLL